MHRGWIGIGLLVATLSGCAQLRQNQEYYMVEYVRSDLKRTVKMMQENGDSDCNEMNLEIPNPGIVLDRTIDRAKLVNRIVIHYPPGHMDSIKHEAYHFFIEHNRRGTAVNWECLQELVAIFGAQRAYMQTQNRILKEDVRRWKRWALGN